jgi:histidinol dehydrogenase
VKELVWAGDARALVAELRGFAPPAAEVAAAVTAIVAEVREGGDAAVREHTLRLDGVELPERYAEQPERLREALAGLAPSVRNALQVAAANIRTYHEREAPRSWRETLPQGQVVGQEIVPVGVAGLYVPGGLADYPSSVLMTAIPAQVAGVRRVVVCSPPRRGGGAARGVAAACALLGVDDLVPIGGAQAVAAMAFGTGVVPRCDIIVGPGNAYVTEAKRQLMGQVGIDALAGPSEVLVIADETADPAWLAADLLAQAEHGSGAMACLADVGGTQLAAVRAAVAGLAAELGLAHDNVALVACPDRDAAVALCNAFAPEHLELHARDAAGLVPRVCNAGAVFVGGFAATAFADYAAGSNHVLPTGGSARFAQGLSVTQFQKRVAVVELDAASAAALAPHVAAIADEEGLRAHARSARMRAAASPPAAPSAPTAD